MVLPKIIKFLENYAVQEELTSIFCKVRMTVIRNIKLYSSVGYSIYDEEVVHKPNGLSIKIVSMMKNLVKNYRLEGKFHAFDM